MKCPRCQVTLSDDHAEAHDAGFSDDEIDALEGDETRAVDRAKLARLVESIVKRGAAPKSAIFCPRCIIERAAPVPPLDVEAVFGKEGPLAKGKAGYESRAGQVKLSRAVFDALAGSHHLLAESPCGSGKSLGYGVPASWLAANGKKVLIVTATIALQEQLALHDLPALQKALPWKFTFGLMKGKSNFLCREQMDTVDAEGLIDTRDRDDYLVTLKWARKTIDDSTGTMKGDKNELPIKPSPAVWGRFSTSSEECPGSKCPSYKSCYATLAKKRAAEAGIIVTNYHMLFLDMAYGGTILPKADVVILDEAHSASDIARDLLGFRISAGSFARFSRDADKRGFPALGRAMTAAARAFFDTVLRFHDSPHYKDFLRWPAPFSCDDLEAAVVEYAQACTKSHLVEHALGVVRRIREGLTLEAPNCVYFIEVTEDRVRNTRRAALQARYVEVAPVLAVDFWPSYSSVVAVSATLTTDGRFDFVRRETGAPPRPETREIIVETPFDFARQALLVQPVMPEPNDPQFAAAVARELSATIEACGGRTLALFTSFRVLNEVYERIRHQFPHLQILRQGTAPPAHLIAEFKRDVSSVLLGTTSFATGVDVQGEALTAVVIDRIPFGQPGDPVAMRIAERDRGAFATYTTPRAILELRQRVGRLIRSRGDVGAVVILDRRLTSKAYGARFLKSLPVMATATSAQAIPAFLESRKIGERGAA